LPRQSKATAGQPSTGYKDAFSPLWSGQNPTGCKEIVAARLTQELTARPRGGSGSFRVDFTNRPGALPSALTATKPANDTLAKGRPV